MRKGVWRRETVMMLSALLVGMAGTLRPAAAAEQDGAAGAAEPDAAAQAAMRKGLDWLENKLNEDGSWSNRNYPAMTALGLWAFARSDHPQREAVCAKAASFIEGFVREDGGIYKPATGGRGTGGLSTYNTAICMIALHTYDRARYAQQILKAREFLAGSQLVGDSSGAGGFGYDRAPPADAAGKSMRRSRADLSNTGWALQAMRVTQDLEDLRPGGETVDMDWPAAVEFLETLQNNDRDDPEHYGGFGYEQGGSRGGTFVRETDGTVQLRGYGSMTYAGLESMIYAQVDRTDPRVRSALQWAERHWSVDENPGMGQKGLFYYFNILSKALSLYGADTLRSPGGEVIPWKEQLIGKLSAIQRADGSWVNQDNQFWEADPVLVTSYAILSLEYALGI